MKGDEVEGDGNFAFCDDEEQSFDGSEKSAFGSEGGNLTRDVSNCSFTSTIAPQSPANSAMEFSMDADLDSHVKKKFHLHENKHEVSELIFFKCSQIYLKNNTKNLTSIEFSIPGSP